MKEFLDDNSMSCKDDWKTKGSVVNSIKKIQNEMKQYRC